VLKARAKSVLRYGRACIYAALRPHLECPLAARLGPSTHDPLGFSPVES
jgi:hypothetical protein